jgi:hypothetical protein
MSSVQGQVAIDLPEVAKKTSSLAIDRVVMENLQLQGLFEPLPLFDF